MKESQKRNKIQASVATSLEAENLDKLFATLPHLSKAKLALQLLLEGHPQAKEYGEGVLLDLENLEIGTLYDEAHYEDAESAEDCWIV